MIKITNQAERDKLKDNLEKYLGRVATASEKINAEKDPGLLLQILEDRINDLDTRLKKLE